MRQHSCLGLLLSFLFLWGGSTYGQQTELDSLLSLSKSRRKDSAFSMMLTRIGELYINTQPDSSRYFSKLGLEMAKELDLLSIQANCLNHIGVSFQFEGIYDSALFYMQKAAEICDTQGFDKLYSTLMGNIGIIYLSKEDFDLSIRYSKQAEKAKVSIGDSLGLARVYNNLGSAFYNSENYDSAFYFYQKCLQTSRSLGSKFGMAISYSNLGAIETARENLQKAQEFYERALSLRREIGDKRGQAYTLSNLGTALLNQTLPSKAIPMLLEALELAEQTNYKEAKINALKALNEAYALENRYEEAYEVFIELYNLNDSTQKILASENMAEMEAKFQAKQKDAEIARQNLVVSQKQNQLYLAIIISIIFFSVAILGFLWFRNKQLDRQRKVSYQLSLKKQEAESLQQLDKLKSNFFANISHEFRTPLTLILGPLGQLQKKDLGKENRLLLEMMERNGQRLLQLINQLLDLSKVEAGKMPLNKKTHHLQGLIRRIAANFESMAQSKNIGFHIQVPAEDCHLLMDADKLTKILTNLLSNSFKFTPEEGDVWLKTEIGEHELHISIQDNGIGMSEEQISHVFDRFYQAKQDIYEGTGIGLALSRELAELHGGEIIVSSSPDEGSMFTVILPLELSSSVPVEAEMPERNSSKASKEDVQLISAPTSTSRHEGERVLLVEDNEDLRKYIRKMLSPHYQVFEAKNGMEGKEKAFELIPDLILSDVMMPEMDGNAFAEAIKNDSRSSHIPVVLLTAKTGRDNKIEGLKRGADDYIAKPFDEEELLIRIKNLIDNRKRLRRQMGKDILKLSPEEIQIESAEKKFLTRAIQIIETYMGDETFTIEDWGREIGMSRSQLHRKIKALTDQSPSVFLRTIRLKRARQMLVEGYGTASEIAYAVGFGSPAYFSKCYRDQFGISPSETRV